MPIAREDILPPQPGAAAVLITTMSDGSVLLQQDDQTVVLHRFHAAEIAGFLWPGAIAAARPEAVRSDH